LAELAALPKFASTLFEEAKRFMEKATEAKEPDAKLAYLHAGLLVGFAAFEAHVNAMCDDFLSREELSPHERGMLAEHSVKLVDGAFEEQDTLQIQRLEDRILFLCRRFSSKPIDRKASYWGNFKNATNLRNILTHPKNDASEVTLDGVKRAITAIVELLNVMYTSVYGKKLPAYHRQLSSKLTF
jgi:phosphopantetheinyl transferase (holo-ACP synthase)